MNESKNQPAEGNDPKNKEVEGHASKTPTQKPAVSTVPKADETTVPRDDV